MRLGATRGSLGTRDGRKFTFLTRVRSRLDVHKRVRKNLHIVILSWAALSLNT